MGYPGTSRQVTQSTENSTDTERNLNLNHTWILHSAERWTRSRYRRYPSGQDGAGGRSRLFVGGIFAAAGQRFAPIHSLAVYDLRTQAWARVGRGVSRQ